MIFSGRGLFSKNSLIFGMHLVDVVFGIFAFLICVNMVKGIENRFFPVITDFNIENIYDSNSDRSIIMHGSLNKLRSCTFENLVAYVYHNGEKTPYIADVTFLDTLSKNRAPILQKFGPWSIIIEKNQNFKINFYATHNCIALYKTNTNLGSFDVNYRDGEYKITPLNL